MESKSPPSKSTRMNLEGDVTKDEDPNSESFVDESINLGRRNPLHLAGLETVPFLIQIV